MAPRLICIRRIDGLKLHFEGANFETASFSSKPDSLALPPPPSPLPMASLRAEEFRPVNTVLAHDKFKPFESGAGLT